MKFFFSLTGFLLLLTPCAPTKAYLGPYRPQKELATVYYYDKFGISLSELSVDGVNQGLGMGLQVMAGAHTARTEFSTAEDDCTGYGGFCEKIVRSGTCTGTFVSEPKKEYHIEVSGIAENAWMSIIDGDTKQPVGSGHCQVMNSNYVYNLKR